MNEQIDIKKVEKKAWISTFQDGLWDIYIGLIITGLGFPWLGSYFGLPETIGVLVTLYSWDIGAMLIFALSKKFITKPRMGYVKFGKKRKKRNKYMALILIAMYVFTLITFIFTFLGMFQVQLPKYLVMLIIGLLFVTLPFSIVAYSLQINRIYIYALFGGLSLFVSELLTPIIPFPFNDIIPFGGTGLIITSTGIKILIKFIRKHSEKGAEVAE